MKQIAVLDVVKDADVAGGWIFDVDDTKFPTGKADIEVNMPTAAGATPFSELTAATSLAGEVLRLLVIGLG